MSKLPRINARGKSDGDDEKKDVTPAEIGEHLEQVYRWAKDASGVLYIFADGVYQPRAEDFVRKQIRRYLESLGLENEWRSRLANEVIAYLVVDAPVLWVTPPGDILNVQNGLLNLETGTLAPHSPEFLSPVRLLVKFDHSATCPNWDRFLATTFPEDAAHLGFEIVAWAMSPGCPAQTAVLLFGDGANGKSVFLAGLRAFLGTTNVSAVSLQKLEADRFAAARLVGKLANICPDIPRTKLFTTGAFKGLTGGDLIHAEKKFRDSFEFESFAKLIFSANQAPRSDDPTNGFFRRWLVIPFHRVFDENNPNRIPREELDGALSSPEELSGVLNRAMAAWPKVRKHGLSMPPSCREAGEDFRAESDPVRTWLSHAVRPDATEQGFITKSNVWERYTQAANLGGWPVQSRKGFGQAFKRAMPHVRDGQRTVRGKRFETYEGIRWRPVSLHPADFLDG